MRIKEFKIEKYGPISSRKRFVLKDFNIFWGKNEEGKTLTIEALIKLLIGKYSRKFENIDRVEEVPIGYVVMESNEGKELIFPNEGVLTDILGISTGDFRNIFLIRNSDLSISDEENFYSSIVDKLTGLNLERIRRIKDKILSIVNLTPNFQIKNTVDSGKLKSRYESAKKVLTEIEKLLKELQDKDFDRIELEIVKATDEIEQVKENIEQLENARKKRNLQNALKIIEEYHNAAKKLDGLLKITQEELKRLIESQSFVRTRKEDVNDDKKRLESIEKEYSQELEKLNGKRNLLSSLEDKKSKLDVFKERLKSYIEKYEKYEGFVSFEKKTLNIVVVSALILLISILGMIVRAGSLFQVTFIISGVISLFLGGVKIYNACKGAYLSKVFSSLKNELIKLNIEKDTSNWYNHEEILRSVASFEEKYEDLKKDIEYTQTKVSNMHSKINELRTKIESEIKDINNKESEIRGILYEAGVESVDEYTKKLNEKRVLENSLVGFIQSLKTIYPEMNLNNITEWEKALSRFEPYPELPIDIEYSEEKYSELKERYKQLEEKLQYLESLKDSYSDKFRSIEREAQSVLMNTEVVSIGSLADLEKITGDLKEFIRDVETSIEDGKKVINILEKMETERKAEISELLSNESSTVEYFKFFTDNLYKEILFDTDEKKIIAVRSDGVRLSSEKLSSGAYDQLYLAIRLGLAEKVFQDSKGFFIMDDPFIKSDPVRLEKQLAKLTELSEKGWQIVYFSAKSEILEWAKEFSEKNSERFLLEPMPRSSSYVFDHDSKDSSFSPSQ